MEKELQQMELHEMADLLEVLDFENESTELVERARLTADQNPVSETAFDIREELMSAIRSY